MIFNPPNSNDPNNLVDQGIIYDDWYDFWPRDDQYGSNILRTLSQKVICLSIMYDWLYDQLDATERTQIQDTIITDLAYTFPQLQFGGNYMGGIRATFNREDASRLRMEHNPLALLLGAMSIYGENSNYSTSQADADIATVLASEFTNSYSHINRYFSPDNGAEFNGVSYSLWMFPILVAELEAWNHWTGGNHWNDQNVKNRFSKLADWLAYEVLPYPREQPNSMLNTLNDAIPYQYGSMGMLLVLSTKYPDKAGLMRWVFNNTVQNIYNLLYDETSDDAEQEIHGNSLDFILPITTGYSFVNPVEPSTILPLSRFLTWDGLVEIRTSQTWGDANDIEFAFSSQPIIHPLTGVFNHHHEHYDKNNFTLFAYGDNYLIDYGLGKNTPSWHNVILIDGVGQTSGLSTQGEITEYKTSSKFDFIDGNATHAYNEMNWGIGMPPVTWTAQNPPPSEYGTLNPVQQAHRYVTFSRAMDNIPPYFIVADDIQKDGNTHIYTWRFQTAKNQSAPNPIRLSGSNGNYLDMWISSTSNLSTSYIQPPQGNSSIDETNDICSPLSDPPTENAYETEVSTTSAVVNPYFHFALLPHKSGDPTPTYSTTTITNGSIITLGWPSPNAYTDYSIFKYQNASQATGQGFVTDAKLSRVRIPSGSSNPTSFLVAQGTLLTYNGQDIVNLYGQQGTVMRYGSEVDITGASIGYFRVYAPNTTIVKVNSTSVSFVQVGDYVESNNVTVIRTWSGSITSAATITVSPKITLTISPGSIVKPSGGLTINGAFIANGTSSQPILFTSSAQPGSKGCWSKIQLLGGPNSLSYCTINNPNYGLWVSNQSTTLIDHCTVQNCLNSGIYSLNTNKSSSSTCLVQYSTIQNCGTGLSVANGRADVLLSTIQNNSSNGVYTYNSTVYVGNCLVTSNGSSGCFETGSGNVSKNYLSFMSSIDGCNTITNNGGSEVQVGNGQTWMGSYDPGSGQETMAQNIVTDGYTYAGHLVSNASTLPISAQRDYWGTNYANGWNSGPGAGTIDTSYRLISAPTDCALPGQSPRTIAQWDGVNFGVTDPAPALIHSLVVAVQNNGPDAYNSFYELYSLVGVGGIYRNVMSAPTWNQFLTQAQINSPSAKLRDAATIFMTEEQIASGNYAQIFRTVNQMPTTVTKLVEPELWEYLNETKFALLLKQGLVGQARATFSRIQSSGIQTDTSLFGIMERLINEVAQDSLNIQTVFQAANVANSGENESILTSTQMVASQFSLSQNYPNPFNPMTQITYGIPEDTHVTLKIYNILGEEVVTLVDANQTAGFKSASFDASKFSSGIYFYKLVAGSFSSVKKMILLK